MFDMTGIERRLDKLIQEIHELKALMKELINVQPHCTCYDRKVGEAWTCEVHGYVTRTEIRP